MKRLDPLVPPEGCLWHAHSLFSRCPNGLTLTEYLSITAIAQHSTQVGQS